MIFLSHNHADKPVVEPVALRLREIFGQDQVFYDSWSIQPGEGLIDRMNDGLTSPKFFFYFVSANSLLSNMVKLEWQNALYKATRGECKVVPVRVDGSPMPAILSQAVYIDMFAHGLEAAISQIVGVAQGMNTFRPQYENFSNLTFSLSGDPCATVVVKISAAHLMEPNPYFIVLAENEKDDVFVWIEGAAGVHSSFHEGRKVDGYGPFNGFGIGPFGLAITPRMPLKITMRSSKGKPVIVRGVVRRVSDTQFESIPQAA